MDSDALPEAPPHATEQVLLDEFERRRRAREVAVPTDDAQVKIRLRELGEPICLFGEGPMERRERLRFHMSKLPADQFLGQEQSKVSSESDESDMEMEEFYTEGKPQLLEARRWIARYSLPRAKRRLAQQRQEQEVALLTIKKQRQQVNAHLKQTTIYGSQVADSRPISACRFSPNSKLLVTGAWSGQCKLWKIPSCEMSQTLQGHTDRVSTVDFHPRATVGLDPSVANLATGGADSQIHLWSLDQTSPQATFSGHSMRISQVRYHPSGRFLGSTSFDTTWRLWDIETQTELLLQEGHSKEVFGLAFQCDGSLVATGGFDGIAKLWDLRSGRGIFDAKGHVKEIYGIDFSPNGYQLATSSADHTIRIFDLRQMKPLTIIPAHTSIIPDIRFYQGLPNLDTTFHAQDGLTSGSQPMAMDMDASGASSQSPSLLSPGVFLVSCSYDGTVKLWSADDWQLVTTLSDHNGRVINVDCSSGK
ncbi:hypothetical protein IWQ62_000614 [Dispira parvispora]|uniref:Pre-mRNA processing factor 4 (PRP4)-like domain-containing protein n=1 Tax=Dispira parvispora TaxID=1520584 RepID=A0A9W8E9Z3_9FUNG|nr:hypothetical protein IWQ62_000614 [Dispira parvispora]